MNPACSVVLLTTLCGMSQGVFIMVLLGDLAGAQQRFLLLGTGAALVLAALGLVASFFHLGRPARAWRAVAQFRTSWLSREVILLPLFMLLVLLYGWSVRAGWGGGFLAGLPALVACIALWVCTAMIYMCIEFIQEWASPYTLANFVLLSLASGATLALNLSLFSDWGIVHLLAWASLLLTLAAGAVRGASLARNARLRPKSTLRSAIGVTDPRITQRSMGTTGGTFNTREFFHGRTLAFLRSVKWLFIALTFILPALLVAAALAGAPAYVVLFALTAQSAGVLFERWYFFAQARHPQNLYYQVIS